MKKAVLKVLLLGVIVLITTAVCARGVLQSRSGQQQPRPTQVLSVVETTSPPDQPPEQVSNRGPMKLVTVANAESRGAVCNDGSAAAYYFRGGSGEGSSRWVIHLQGGGFCYDQQTCSRRDKQEPKLMTNNKLPRSRPGNGILSNSGASSTDFANNNHVFVAYCSSDLWSGNKVASPETGGLHFRGATILHAVIEDLSDPSITPQPNLSNATQVLFSGTSAGGAGVLVHLDWLAKKLPSAAVRGIDDAGWFIDIQPFDSSIKPITEQAQKAYNFWNASVDESCAAANTGKEGRCYIGEYVYPYLSAPLFVQIAQFDGPQLLALGLNLPIDDQELTYAAKFGEAVRASLEPVSAAYSPASRTHGLLTNKNFWTIRIKGSSLHDVLVNWFFNQRGSKKLIEEGDLPLDR